MLNLIVTTRKKNLAGRLPLCFFLLIPIFSCTIDEPRFTSWESDQELKES